MVEYHGPLRKNSVELCPLSTINLSAQYNQIAKADFRSCSTGGLCSQRCCQNQSIHDTNCTIRIDSGQIRYRLLFLSFLSYNRKIFIRIINETVNKNGRSFPPKSAKLSIIWMCGQPKLQGSLDPKYLTQIKQVDQVNFTHELWSIWCLFFIFYLWRVYQFYRLFVLLKNWQK